MNLFDLFATINLDSQGFEQGLDNAEGKASSFGSKAGNAVKAGMKVATAAITAASGAVVGFTGIAVKTGQEFDSAMSQIAATLGITTEEIENNVGGAGDTFAALRDKAKEMGAATNFSASQAADGLNILAMSGFNAEQSMAMLEDVLHLAAAGSMDMASAAGFISGAMKGFNDATKDSGYYADLMAKGATLANTSVSQLGDAMSSGAAGAAAYSQTAESMTVALLRLAEQGDVGAAAGTALSAAMKNLYTPTDQAAGALAELGVAAYDSNGAARDFNTVVNELDAALSGYSEEQRNAYKQTIFGIQGLNAYNKMTVTSTNKQKQWSAALAAASDGAGEAAKQYNTMTDNLQGDVDIWNSALDGFKIEISDRVMPTIRSFVQLGSTGMGKITEAFKKGGFAEAATALGEVLGELVGKITEVIPTVVESATNLLMAFAQALVDNSDLLIQTGFDVFLMLLQGISGNSEMISTAIGELITSIVTWVGEYSSVIVEGLIGVLTSLATTITDNLPIFVEQFSYIIPVLIGEIGTFIGEAAPILISAFVDVMLALAQVLTDPDIMFAFAENIPYIIESIGQAILDSIPVILDMLPTIITNITETITDNLPLFLMNVTDVLSAIAEGIIEALPLILEKVPEIIDSIITALVELTPQLVETGIILLTALVENLSEIIEIICKALPDIVDSVVEALVKMVPLLVEAGVTLLTALVENLDTIIETICGALPDIIDSIIGALLTMLPLLVDAGVTLLTALVDNLPTIIRIICDRMPEIVSRIISALIDMLPRIVDAGVTLLTALIDNMPVILRTIGDKMPEIIGKIVRVLTDNIPKIVKTGITLLTALIDDLPEIVKTIAGEIPRIINGIINKLTDLIPEIVTMGFDLLVSLLDNLPQIIIELVKQLPQIITAIVNGLLGGVSELWGVGKALIEGLWNGILGVGDWLKEKIGGFFSGIWGGIKNFFGIASPSKKFAWVGEMLDKGLAQGIDRYADVAIDAAESMAEDVSGAVNPDMDFTVGAGGVGAGNGLYGHGNSVVINVQGAEGQNVNELAEIISQRMAYSYNAEKAVWA